MRLITSLVIRDFRSISHSALEVPGGYLPIVGANNSGKSNILRALNLFFNDEVEPGVPLRLSTDFHNPSRRRKKEISIDVTFDLPGYFKYRKNLRDGLTDMLGRTFTLRKTWAYAGEQSRNEYSVAYARRLHHGGFETLDSDDVGRARQFLKLIRFRYHPNHIHPSEVLRKEEKELQAALLFRLNRAKETRSESVSRVFTQMRATATDLLKPISTRLKSATPHLEGVELSMPASLGDLLFSFVPNIRGYRWRAVRGAAAWLRNSELSYLPI